MKEGIDLEKINIWTDGSFRKQICGCAIYIEMVNDEDKSVLLYFNSLVKSSTCAELLSVITAIKYILYIGFDTAPLLTIFTDEISIVDAYNNKLYNKWEQNGWRTKNGKNVKSNINLWYHLTCLVKVIPDNHIEFIYIDKNDKGNRLVHKYANEVRNMPLFDHGKLELLRYKNGVVRKREVIENLENKVVRDILKFKTPWEELRSKGKFNYNTKNIVHIDPCKIHIKEEKHIKCNQIYFGDKIKKAISKGDVSHPIIVNKEGDKYVLIEGIKNLTIAKLLNLPHIPCVIINKEDITNTNKT